MIILNLIIINITYCRKILLMWCELQCSDNLRQIISETRQTKKYKHSVKKMKKHFVARPVHKTHNIAKSTQRHDNTAHWDECWTRTTIPTTTNILNSKALNDMNRDKYIILLNLKIFFYLIILENLIVMLILNWF